MFRGVYKSEHGKGVSNSIEPRFLILLGSGAFVGPVRSNLMSTLPGSTSASVRPPMTTEYTQFLRSGISIIWTARNTRIENDTSGLKTIYGHKRNITSDLKLGKGDVGCWLTSRKTKWWQKRGEGRVGLDQDEESVVTFPQYSNVPPTYPSWHPFCKKTFLVPYRVLHVLSSQARHLGTQWGHLL